MQSSLGILHVIESLFLCYLLCISTSKRVLRMPFPGQNQFFNAKTTFCVILYKKVYFVRKSISTSKWRAEHLFAGRNTQQLLLNELFKIVYPEFKFIKFTL